MASVGKEVEELELSYTASKSINWTDLFRKIAGQPLLKLTQCIPYDLAI